MFVIYIIKVKFKMISRMHATRIHSMYTYRHHTVRESARGHQGLQRLALSPCCLLHAQQSHHTAAEGKIQLSVLFRVERDFLFLFFDCVLPKRFLTTKLL